jgi:hypothetical protein
MTLFEPEPTIAPLQLYEYVPLPPGAEKSENLLYSGTLTRPRASFAEVKITFDNSTHFFPVDYTEVTIRRRVTRDGTSAYFINEGEVRMRDIVDFFSKARLGLKVDLLKFSDEVPAEAPVVKLDGADAEVVKLKTRFDEEQESEELIASKDKISDLDIEEEDPDAVKKGIEEGELDAEEGGATAKTEMKEAVENDDDGSAGNK